MKLFKYEIPNYQFKKKNFENNICLFCGFRVKEDICPYCGTISPYIYYKERIINRHNHIYNLEFNLSKSQEKASHFFLNNYKKKKDAFLYAVCGSGKTEIMYETINYALNNGDKVVITIPRKEIVKELYERLVNVFKNTLIKYIDGNHHDDNCDLLLSTVNQLVNYEDEFDLIILDEADAYPYSDSDYLKGILKKSLKKTGVIFYMSATIKSHMPKNRFILKRRYHNALLDMPKFIKVNDYSNLWNNAIFSEILLTNGRKSIIYVSSINTAKIVSENLGCPCVTSSTKNIDNIISLFRNGNLKYIVSTTLLERGITIKGCDVIIYDADSSIFDKNTIIQISGRVGRKIDDKHGNIYIFYKKYHLKYSLVKRYIRRMNEV